MEFFFKPPPITAYHSSTLTIKCDKLHIMTIWKHFTMARCQHLAAWWKRTVSRRTTPFSRWTHYRISGRWAKSYQHFDFLFISLSLKGIKSFNIVSSGSPPRAHNLCARLHDGAGKALEEGRSASPSCLHRLRRPRCPRPDSFSCPCQVGKQFKHWLKTNRLQRFWSHNKKKTKRWTTSYFQRVRSRNLPKEQASW